MNLFLVNFEAVIYLFFFLCKFLTSCCISTKAVIQFPEFPTHLGESTFLWLKTHFYFVCNLCVITNPITGNNDLCELCVG